MTDNRPRSYCAGIGMQVRPCLHTGWEAVLMLHCLYLGEATPEEILADFSSEIKGRDGTVPRRVLREHGRLRVTALAPQLGTIGYSVVISARNSTHSQHTPYSKTYSLPHCTACSRPAS